MKIYDLIIIGAGPCGLSCGIEASKHKLDYLIIEKGNITESIRRYPINMIFFSTSENIEVGELPLVSHGFRPTRTEALKYYRKVAAYYKLKTQIFTTVKDVVREGQSLKVITNKRDFYAKKLIVATGYYDLPKLIEVPGEDLPHVTHYYDEPYQFTGTKCVVVGGSNSAIETALDLYRNGADVTIIHQFENLDKSAKYWIVPDLSNRIKNGEIKAYFNSLVQEIKQNKVLFKEIPTNHIKEIDADFVFLMTGYRPDASLLQKIGIELNGPAYIPTLNQETYETNVEGIYMAGSVVGGEETAKVFIENGRYHAKPIIEDILKKLKSS